MARRNKLRIIIVTAALAIAVIVATGYLFQRPSTPVDYIMLSRQYATESRINDAIRAMDSAISLAPDDPALYVERGQRIILLYEWDRALADYDRALELDSTYADAYFYRGVLYASVPEAGDARAQAVADFEQYLAFAPDGEHAEEARGALAALGGG